MFEDEGEEKVREARPKVRQVEGGYARGGERQGGEGGEDDKESSEDAQMTGQREREWW